MRADVVIVGAGSAGAAAAAMCAERGMRVVCVDRRPLEEAGGRWVNDVPRWMFREAGVGPPPPFDGAPEGQEHAFHLFAGWGPRRVTVTEYDLVAVDMRELVRRLQARAEAAGATLMGGVHVHGLESGGITTSKGTITAPVVVDASGLAGARLVRQRVVAPHDICAAAQEVRAVRDGRAANDFFAAHGVCAGEVVCFTGVAGGYSIVNVRLVGEHVGVLTGSIPAEGQPSGRELLERFVASQPWIGERVFGGTRAIPLRTPDRTLVRGHVALLGDAAGQVFPAHASGTGPGLIAARLLADALAHGNGLGTYAAAWRRRFGATYAAYDLFRRFSQTRTVEQIALMMRLRLITPATVRAALEERLPSTYAARSLTPAWFARWRSPAWRRSPDAPRAPSRTG